MPDKFEKKMECVVERLRDMRDGAYVENSEDGIVEVLERAFDRGTPLEKARVVMCAIKYGWAMCEKEYHSSRVVSEK